MGLGDFIRRVALPIAGVAIAGPMLGGMFAGAGAGAGGLGALIGGFQSSGLGQAIGLGIKGIGLLSSYRSNEQNIKQLEAANRIQAANTLEAIKLFPIQERALTAEEESVKSGRVLEREQVAEARARITRSQEFGAAALGRESLVLDEKVRQLGEEEQRILGTVSAQAAASGIRVASQAVQLQREDVSTEADFAQAQLQLQREELDQQRLELQQQFQDALFDADFQEKINVRNEQLSLERISFDREVAQEKEKTARHIAAIQGIAIPGEGPEPLTPEEEADRLRNQRQEEERARGQIDIVEAERSQRLRTVPGSGTAATITNPITGEPINVQLGTDLYDPDIYNFDQGPPGIGGPAADPAVDLPGPDFNPLD